MKIKFEIEEPTGGRRVLEKNLTHQISIGKNAGNDILLRDTTLTNSPVILYRQPGSESIWIQSQDPSTKLGDLHAKDFEFPFYETLTIGESKIRIFKNNELKDLPEFPTGTKPWLTCTEEGKQLLWMTKKAAQTPLSIYIAGETGTGKEVLANLTHQWSSRAGAPFIPLHCGALSLNLVESELFGHVKGAFTGAHQPRVGALLQANSGTLFLDEVGDLPMDIQVKLLRFLENGEIRPVGSDRTFRADVRILCATHLPLKKLVEEGKFRRDLYFRLASITLEIPSLKSRPDDIEMLSQKFASDLKKTVSAQAITRLQAYSWPGNVRELRHAIERASGLSSPFETRLNEVDFDFLLNVDNIEASPELEFGAPILKIKEMERVLIVKALKITHGNRKDAAKLLGIARSTLFEMLKRHRIVGPKAKMEEIRKSYPKNKDNFLTGIIS